MCDFLGTGWQPPPKSKTKQQQSIDYVSWQFGILITKPGLFFLDSSQSQLKGMWPICFPFPFYFTVKTAEVSNNQT